ncbi:hypothetical protein SAMN05216318_1501 [Nitrosomonas eutropha]|nr:hypothetical protein SAMN05216318_1501 [Nitrosomonas eutropha]
MSTATPCTQFHQENLRQPAQHAAVENQLHYEWHRPEETTLYWLVQEHIETFFIQVEMEIGFRVPDFVKDEFGAFRGMLTHGFLCLRCTSCAHEKRVAVFLQTAWISPLVRRAAHGADGCSPG